MGKHALLVGVSKFQDPALGGLKAPAEDVQAFAGILQDKDRGGFDTVITSLDEDVETIRGKLSDLLDDRRPSDSVLIYYSGHGINAASGQLFLATEKTASQRPRMYSLSATEIRDMMGDSRASQLIVVLDCCHSGAFMEGAKGAAAPVSQQTFSAGDGAEGEYVLMSCNAMQVSLDGVDSALSRFTSWLVDGLRGDAAPDNPVITLDDLYDYVCRRARAAGAAMTPQRLVNRNSGIPEIARNPAPKAPALPADVLARLEDADWKTRLAAVTTLDDLSRQDRLRPLVRNAAAGRIAVERDTDVTGALARLISRLTDRAEEPPRPVPLSSAWPAAEDAPWPAPAATIFVPSVKAAPPDTAPPVTQTTPAAPPRVFEGWEAKVLTRAGLTGAGLSEAALKTLQDRAKALRNGTWNYWTALACIFILPYAGYLISQDRYDPSGETGSWTVILAAFAGAVIGLFKTKEIAPGPFADESERKIVETAPVIPYFWRRYDAKLFRRSCWIILGASIIGIFAAGVSSINLADLPKQ
jgi:hypothetical protein